MVPRLSPFSLPPLPCAEGLPLAAAGGGARIVEVFLFSSPPLFLSLLHSSLSFLFFLKKILSWGLDEVPSIVWGYKYRSRLIFISEASPKRRTKSRLILPPVFSRYFSPPPFFIRSLPPWFYVGHRRQLGFSYHLAIIFSLEL